MHLMMDESWEIGLDWTEQHGGLPGNSTRAGKHSVTLPRVAQKSNRILKSEASSLNLRVYDRSRSLPSSGLRLVDAHDDFGQQTSESEAVQIQLAGLVQPALDRERCSGRDTVHDTGSQHADAYMTVTGTSALRRHDDRQSRLQLYPCGGTKYRIRSCQRSDGLSRRT